METPVGGKPEADVRDYLAEERTFLAWIRTGLALMGFGFVVARFGLFLRELDADQRVLPLPSHGLSPWFGTLLIAAGVMVNVVAGWRHLRLARELDHGDTGLSRSSSPAVAIAFFLALVGLAMASYLVFIQGPIQPQAQRRKEI